MNEHNDDLELELKERLKTTECPFTWMPHRIDSVIPQYVLKKSIPKCHNDDLTIYSKYMRKTYELGIQDNVTSAIQAVEEWEDFVNSAETRNSFFIRNSLALKHVLYSSKAHLYLQMRDFTETQVLVETINQMECKSKHLKAAIFGLKAKFFNKYKSEGHERALPNAQTAMELEPDEPEWIYLTAKSMSDIHRGELNHNEGSELSRNKEIELFEKLISLKRKGIYFIRLGCSYHDLANYKISKNQNENHRCQRWSAPCCSEIKNCYDKGVQYFRKGIAIDPSKKNYLFVIRGITWISYNYRTNYKGTARTWVEAVLEGSIDNDDKLLYTIGKYFQYVEKNHSECGRYITRAAELGNLNAKKDLIMMRFNEQSEIYDPHVSPVEEMYEMCNTYCEKAKKIQTLCQLASYYLFIEDNFLRAKELILQVKLDDPGLSSPYLRNHRSWFYNQHILQDLLNVVHARVSVRLEELDGEGESEEREELRDFVNRINDTI